MTPGDARRAYENGAAARQVLNDAEDDLRTWEKNADSYNSLGRDDDLARASMAVGADADSSRSETPVMTGAGGFSADGGHNPVARDSAYVSPTPTSHDGEESASRG